MTTFKPMLAGKFPGNDKLKFPLRVQPKLDGIRACVVDGKLLSRSLKPIPNAEIRAALERPEFEGLDGELMVGSPTAEDCYRRTVSFAMSDDKTGEPWCYHVFDIWNHPGTFVERHGTLRTLFGRWDADQGIESNYLDTGRLRRVPTFVANTLDSLAGIEANFVGAGYEGAILRGPDTFYKFGRGSATKGDLLKLKRFVDSEAVVVGVYELEHNDNVAFTNELGRTARSSAKAGQRGGGTLGGLVVRLMNDHEGILAGTQFRVGTGFSEALRASLWAEAGDFRDGLNGRIAKFKWFPVGSKDKPRHPVFLGWRDARDMG